MTKNKISPRDMQGLRSESHHKKSEEKPKIYANILKGSIKNEINSRKGKYDQHKYDSSPRMILEELFYQKYLS
jgi:hypothetical protein